MWMQKEINLKPRPRGFHLVTEELLHELPELRQFSIGMMNVFVLHTSASLTLNENANPTVRQDFESYFSRAVPEDEPYYRHQDEDPDDLPAHLNPAFWAAASTSQLTMAVPGWGRCRGYICANIETTAAAAGWW